MGLAALFKAAADQWPQLGVTLAARALGLAAVRVEAAPGNLQRLGHLRNGELALHSLHQIELFGGISADKMPTAFFQDVALALHTGKLLAKPAQLTLLRSLGSERPGLRRRNARFGERDPTVEAPGGDAQLPGDFRG